MPLALAAGDQYAVCAASIVLLVIAFQAVAETAELPIFKVPLLRVLITKALTLPSTSASLPWLCRLTKVNAIWLSSLPTAMGVVKAVKVGASLTAVTLKLNLFGDASKSTPPIAMPPLSCT